MPAMRVRLSMFITIPKVFASMGLGTLVGVVFFTCWFSLLLLQAQRFLWQKPAVSTFQDELRLEPNNFSTFAVFMIMMIVLGSLSSSRITALLPPSPSLKHGVFSDFFDFLTNSIMMPVSAFATCVLIVVTVGIKWIENEVKQSSKFRYECVYGLFVRFLAPVCWLSIFISSLANVLGFIHM